MASIASRFLLVALCLSLLVACGEEMAPQDRILLERQKFEVRMLSWAPLPDGRIALDLEIRVTGQSELSTLTVSVQQVDSEQRVLREDALPLDVAGMGFDDQRALTAHVPAAEEGLDALALLLENLPPEDKRTAYPEFAGS